MNDPTAGDADRLSHVRADGSAHMVDVTAKNTTRREATARGTVITRPDVIAQLVDGTLPKGEVLPVARVAGIMGAKRTPDLVPLCHPLALSGITVDFEVAADRVEILATVRTTGRTGVEMEALTAVSVAALTVFDMIKAVDKAARITDLEVTAKSGGKSGAWRRDAALTTPAGEAPSDPRSTIGPADPGFAVGPAEEDR